MRSLGKLEDIENVERIGLISSMLVVIPALQLLVYALIAWQQVGHFPFYGNPDPKNVGADILHVYVWVTSLLSPYILIFGDASAVLFLLIASLQKKKWLRNLAILGLANAFYFWVMLDRPIGLDLMNWIGD